MLGTILRLGFDGTSVARGLKSVSGLVGKFGKEVAIGASRRVGEGMTDLLGKLVMAIPNVISDTMEWSGELADLSTQTGMAVDKLVEFQELLRLTGVDSGATGKMIFTMVKNIKDAAANGGDLADQLKAIGLEAENLKGMAPDKMFEAITKRVGELNKTTVTPVQFTDAAGKVTTKFVELTSSMENLEQFGSDLMGSKMGSKWIGLAKNFSGAMAQAKNNVEALGKAAGGDVASNIDTLGDALGRFPNFARSLGLIALSEFGNLFGFDSIDKLFDKFDPEKFRPKIREITMFISESLQKFLSQDISKSFDDVMKGLGKSFGEGIKSAIFGDGANPKSSTFLQRVGGAVMGASAQNAAPVAPLIEDTNTILSDIRKNTLTARFA